MKSRVWQLILIMLFSVVSLPGKAIVVSLIDCAPGPEIYELCGHSAIRVRGEGIDSVWNYGVFDFAEPNFVYRFVKGETDYMVAGYPFSWFMPEYMAAHRKVSEYDLNLTEEEARELLALLRRQAQPENCRYRYNYLRNNCATRLADLIDSVSGAPVTYSAPPEYDTYRDAMYKMHKNYPWYQFGIDLALGSGLDHPISSREAMFLPHDLVKQVAAARFPDGRPIVKATRVLYEGMPDATLPPTPFIFTPLFWSIVVLTISIVVAILDNYRHRISLVWYAFYFLIAGVAGCLITFLVLVSDHAATSPNILILWLNPFQLIVPAFIWWGVGRRITAYWMWADLCLMLLLIAAWPLQHQVANPAFFPLLASGIVLAASYLMIQGFKGSQEKKLKAKPQRKRKK